MSDTTYFVGMGVLDLRGLCTSLGIDPLGLDKAQMVSAIMSKKSVLADLRRQCTALGLDTDGDENELRMRLTASEPGSLTTTDHKVYTWAAVAFAVLGVASLVVSLPHLTGELVRITGLSLVYAALLAVLIDVGVVAAKTAATLGQKFNLARVRQINQVAMWVCLGFSAVVNASGFLAAESASPFLACVFAGLITGMSWFGFTMSAYLLTHRSKVEPTVDPIAKPVTVKPLSASEKLRAAADELDRLTGIAKSI